MFRKLLLSALFMSLTLPSLAFSFSGTGTREDEARYLHNVKKQDLKEDYGRKKNSVKPSGYMTVEEYEMLSVPKDKRVQEIEIPRPQKKSDMKYIPQLDYEIVRYNNPPGSPDISLGRDFKYRRQQNAQGIVSPDYRILVYPAVYYFTKNAEVACDLFVIPLDKEGSALAKIKKANTMHRDPEPILSTEKSIEEFGIFRTLTPIDFNPTGDKILVKEKIGSKDDGIWQTNAIIYDFNLKKSYKLNEVRDAIVYYWKEYKNLNLNDYRWDIYPLGFDNNNPERIVVSGYAYTGNVPVFLGNWSVDTQGKRVQLVSLTPKSVSISMNGVKMVRSGVVPPVILKNEQKQLKREDKLEAKKKHEAEKAKYKELREDYQEQVKNLEKEYSYEKEEYRLRNKIKGSTSQNDSLEKIEQASLQHQARIEAKEAKEKARLEKKEQKRIEKEIK